MSGTDLTIGDVARLSGVKIPTLRYYETIGLLPSPPRTAGNRRAYSQAHTLTAVFIRHSRELGFDIEAIRALLSLQAQPSQSCAQVDTIAAERLRDVTTRIAQLTALQSELRRMLSECSHGRIGDCRVIEVLSDPRKCENLTQGTPL